jgi:hypothetical protein
MAGSVDYRRLFEAAHEAQLLLDESGSIVTASDGYLRAVGAGPNAASRTASGACAS